MLCYVRLGLFWIRTLFGNKKEIRIHKKDPDPADSGKQSAFSVGFAYHKACV